MSLLYMSTNYEEPKPRASGSGLRRSNLVDLPPLKKGNLRGIHIVSFAQGCFFQAHGLPLPGRRLRRSKSSFGGGVTLAYAGTGNLFIQPTHKMPYPNSLRSDIYPAILSPSRTIHLNPTYDHIPQMFFKRQNKD